MRAIVQFTDTDLRLAEVHDAGLESLVLSALHDLQEACLDGRLAGGTDAAEDDSGESSSESGDGDEEASSDDEDEEGDDDDGDAPAVARTAKARGGSVAAACDASSPRR